MATSRFNARAFTSLATTLLFLIMALTGLVAYLMPAGRIAYWVDWRLWGLTKTSWGNLHIVSSLLFIPFAGFHLYLNWRPFLGYLRRQGTRALELRRELAAALLLAGITLAGALQPLPPLSWLLDLGTSLKDSWVKSPEFEPPFGHAEQISLTVFCRRMEIDLPAALAELSAGGIQIGSPLDTLETIAKANGITPAQLYGLIRSLEPQKALDLERSYTLEEVEEHFAGSGLGQKTLSQVCAENGLDLGTARAVLGAKGVVPGEEEKLKAAAERYGARPIDLLKLLLVREYRLD